MIEHSKGTWNENHTAFKATETSYEHITYANFATHNVQEIDLGKAQHDREVWKQYGKNFKDLADFSEKAVIVIGVGAALAPVAVYITPIMVEGASSAIVVVNDASLLAQAQANVILGNTQRILIEGSLNAMLKTLPRSIVNSAAFWKLFQTMLAQASKGKTLSLKDVEDLAAKVAKELSPGFKYQKTYKLMQKR